jgi:hypothetical protein
MNIRKTIGVGAVALGMAVATSAPAIAGTDDFGSVGNSNLGASVGTTGGSVSVGGYTTTVDGIGTFTGSTTFSGPSGPIAGITENYSTDGLHTTGFIGSNTGSGELELYNGVPRGEVTWNGSTVVCDPICHQE